MEVASSEWEAIFLFACFSFFSSGVRGKFEIFCSRTPTRSDATQTWSSRGPCKYLNILFKQKKIQKRRIFNFDGPRVSRTGGMCAVAQRWIPPLPSSAAEAGL